MIFKTWTKAIDLEHLQTFYAWTNSFLQISDWKFTGKDDNSFEEYALVFDGVFSKVGM